MADRHRESPASLVLVHGSGSGPWIFDGWSEAFGGVEVVAVDLHAGLDVARASHADYAAAVGRACAGLPRPLALCGWSMGGLVVLQAAATVRPDALVVIEPSAPAEAMRAADRDPDVVVADGTFDPVALYGREFPAGMRARPESSRARAERKRGLSVPSLGCPSLVVYGDEFRDERGVPVAALYGSETLDLEGLDHWDVVLDPRVRTAVADWLAVS